METFGKLFASLLRLVYHCFDRVVIQGYLPLLTRPEHIVYFFRDVHGIYPITKQALRQRTQDYQHWGGSLRSQPSHSPRVARPRHEEERPPPGRLRSPYLLAMERRQRFGVYFIFKTMESGPNFRRPTKDDNFCNQPITLTILRQPIGCVKGDVSLTMHSPKAQKHDAVLLNMLADLA
jgi:hypothetical protein